MSVDLNDPRLTAYALGELDDDAERLAVEAELADDADALAFVEGIKQTAFLLSEELRKEPLPAVASGLHKTIEHELCNDELPTTLPISAASGGRMRWIRLSLAAGIVAITGAGLFLMNQSMKAPTNERLLAKADNTAPAPARLALEPQAVAPSSESPVAPQPTGAVLLKRGDSEQLIRENFESPTRAPVAPPAPAAPESGARGFVATSPMTAAPASPTVRSMASGPAPAPVGLGLTPAKPADPNAVAVQGNFRRSAASATIAPAPSYGPATNLDAISGSVGQKQSTDLYSRSGAMAPMDGVKSKQQAGEGFAVAHANGPAAGNGLSAMPGGVDRNFGTMAQRSSKGDAQPSDGAQPAGGAQGAPSTTGMPGILRGRGVVLKSTEPVLPAKVPPQLARLSEGEAKGNQDLRFAGRKDGKLEQLFEDSQVADKSGKSLKGAPEQLGDEDKSKKRLEDAPAQPSDKLSVASPKSEPEVARDVKPQEAAPALPQIAPIVDNPFLSVIGNELSTFSIDVDTGAYSTVRRFLNQNQAPPKDAVRIEEMLNYFTYNDPGPKDEKPFAFNVEIAACPWNGENRLVRVGLKAKTIEADKRPPSNLVFLIDVSGSMSDINKLPLLKAGMKLLVDQLSENDRVAIVVYASDVRVHLPSTPCHRKKVIIDALETLQSGGSTAGGKGIELAYREAVANFIKGGTNRVILATDGDFNVGKSKEELLKESEERAKSGVFLTVLGFGEGNLQEAFMEQLADKGNGQYAYIDTIAEARKVLVHEMTGTLVTVAKDVKIQVEFNPAKVQSYRLIGYENRVMAAQDFRNDKKDAGEIGAGHGVTALYEITPAGAKDSAKAAAKSDRPLKYGAAAPDPKLVKTPAPAALASPESLTIFLRYKAPDGDKAQEIQQGVVDKGQSYGQASNDFKFAAAVAGFGMLLRDSPYKGSLNFSAVSELATPASLEDKTGYRTEFVELVKKAQTILGQ